jgi:ribose 5-phosphate isomerase A
LAKERCLCGKALRSIFGDGIEPFMDPQAKKRAAAQAALAYLPQEGVVGLGSGSTAELFIEEVGALVRAGRRLVGVPTSQESRALAKAQSIPLLDDAGPWEIAVIVDGADEVSASLDVIKGGGACHAREKIVNHASKMRVIVVDDSKLSQLLGEKWPVPIEVLEFGCESTRRALEAFGPATIRRRKDDPSALWLTDAGNVIYDVRTGPIESPAELDASLRAIPGVVETGLFVDRVDVVLVAEPGGMRALGRP